MEILFALVEPEVMAIAMAVALLAGAVKGVVGVAMPTIMISGLSSLVAPEMALAGLILPALVTNGWQALRQGRRAAWESVYRFRVFLGAGLVMLLISAQMVRRLPVPVLVAGIGVLVALFAVMQLSGWVLQLGGSGQKGHRINQKVEAAIGAFAGFIGGLSGIWGPPTVAYLTALDTPKRDFIRVQGVVYGLGALALFVAHIFSGVLRVETLPFSVALLGPALFGMWLGLKVQDRIDQVVFRRAILVVLLIAGLNLVRRGVMG